MLIAVRLFKTSFGMIRVSFTHAGCSELLQLDLVGVNPCSGMKVICGLASFGSSPSRG